MLIWGRFIKKRKLSCSIIRCKFIFLTRSHVDFIKIINVGGLQHLISSRWYTLFSRQAHMMFLLMERNLDQINRDAFNLFRKNHRLREIWCLWGSISNLFLTGNSNRHLFSIHEHFYGLLRFRLIFINLCWNDFKAWDERTNFMKNKNLFRKSSGMSWQ